MEVRADVTMAEMGDFRWLTVSPAGQEDIAIVLMAIPGAPVFDDDTAKAIRDLTAKGSAGERLPGHRRRLRRVRGAEVPRRRVRRAARGAPVRHRLRLPRPLRQPLPAHADHRAVNRPPLPRRFQHALHRHRTDLGQRSGRGPRLLRRQAGLDASAKTSRRPSSAASAGSPSRPPAESDTSVVLMAIPGEPVFTAEAGEQLRDAAGQGRRQRDLPDHGRRPRRLRGRSRPAASTSPEPTEQPWGIDTGFRDPSGNHFRLAQRAEIPAAV